MMFFNCNVAFIRSSRPRKYFAENGKVPDQVVDMRYENYVCRVNGKFLQGLAKTETIRKII